MEKNENSPPEQDQHEPISDNDTLVLKFKNSIVLSCQIFSLITVIFSVLLVFFHGDIIIQAISFFEINNLMNFLKALMTEIGLTALFTIFIAIITGLYLYFRFFSNIIHNTFYDDMSHHFEFYESFSSTVLDVTVLIIIFLYLIILKQAYWEFITAFGVILGLAISIRMITPDYQKMTKKYSAIQNMNKYLDKFHSKSARELFSDEESLSGLLFYGFERKNVTWITGAFFLTIIFAMYGVANGFNILTIIVLELMVIRYAIFESQVGSLPRIPVTLYLIPNEIQDRVYMIRESHDILTILTPYDKLNLVMKSHLRKVEPIIEDDVKQQGNDSLW